MLEARPVPERPLETVLRGRRAIWLPLKRRFGPVPVYDRYSLRPGTRLAGPVPRSLHLLGLVALTAYAMRFVRLFPKTQTPRLSLPGVPERLRSRPPLGALAAALYAGCLATWLLVGSLLGGALG